MGREAREDGHGGRPARPTAPGTPLKCGIQGEMATAWPRRPPLPGAHRLDKYSAWKAREPPGTPSSARAKWRPPRPPNLSEKPVIHYTEKHE